MEDEDADWTPEAPVPVRAGKARAAKKVKTEASDRLSEEAPPAVVDIKTKFPVARIKRIMQADEEVGKVAQVTPHVVCKLLSFTPSLSGWRGSTWLL